MTQVGTVYFCDPSGRHLFRKDYKSLEFRNRVVGLLLGLNGGVFRGCSVLVAPATLPRCYHEIRGTVKAYRKDGFLLGEIRYYSRKGRRSAIKTLTMTYQKQIHHFNFCPVTSDFLP